MKRFIVLFIVFILLFVASILFNPNLLKQNNIEEIIQIDITDSTTTKDKDEVTSTPKPIKSPSPVVSPTQTSIENKEIDLVANFTIDIEKKLLNNYSENELKMIANTLWDGFEYNSVKFFEKETSVVPETIWDSDVEISLVCDFTTEKMFREISIRNIIEQVLICNNNIDISKDKKFKYIVININDANKRSISFDFEVRTIELGVTADSILQETEIKASDPNSLIELIKPDMDSISNTDDFVKKVDENIEKPDYDTLKYIYYNNNIYLSVKNHNDKKFWIDVLTSDMYLYRSDNNGNKYIIPYQKSNVKKEEYIVNNYIDFIEVLGSNRTIKIMPREYDTQKYENSSEFNSKVYENVNYPIKLQGIANLTIEGVLEHDDKMVDFISNNLLKSVFQISYCSDIVIKNLNMGHIEAYNECWGSVVDVSYSDNITFENCRIFGCGIVGLHAKHSKNLKMNNSEITDCRDYEILLDTCRDFVIDNTVISDTVCTIGTQWCKNNLIKDSFIFSGSAMPRIEDANQYSYLSNEGNFNDYVGFGENSKIVDEYTYDLSGFTFNNVHVANTNVYEKHLEFHNRFLTIFSNYQRSTYESNCDDNPQGYPSKNPSYINSNITVELVLGEGVETTYSNVCKLISDFAKLYLQENFYEDEEINCLVNDSLLIEFQDKNKMQDFIQNGDIRELNKYSKFTIIDQNISVNDFFESEEIKIVFEELNKRLEENIIAYDEKTTESIDYGDYQGVEFEDITFENDTIYYNVSIIQEEPLLGDYLHYYDFINLKVDALTGDMFYTHDNRQVFFVNDEIKELFYNMDDYNIIPEKSMFISFKESDEMLIVKIQQWDEEINQSSPLYFIVKNDEGNYSVVKEIETLNYDVED